MPKNNDKTAHNIEKYSTINKNEVNIDAVPFSYTMGCKCKGAYFAESSAGYGSLCALQN